MLSCQFIFFGCELVIFWAPILMQSLLGASMCPKHRINLRVPKPSSVAMATRGEPVQCGSQILQQPWAQTGGGADSSCACAGPGSVSGTPSPRSLIQRVADVETHPRKLLPGAEVAGGLQAWGLRVEWTRAALVAVSGAGFSVSDSPGRVAEDQAWGCSSRGVGTPCTRASERAAVPCPAWAPDTPQCFYYLARVGGNTDNNVWCFFRANSCWEINNFGVGLTNSTSFTFVALDRTLLDLFMEPAM